MEKPHIVHSAKWPTHLSCWAFLGNRLVIHLGKLLHLKERGFPTKGEVARCLFPDSWEGKRGPSTNSSICSSPLAKMKLCPVYNGQQQIFISANENNILEKPGKEIHRRPPKWLPPGRRKRWITFCIYWRETIRFQRVRGDWAKKKQCEKYVRLICSFSSWHPLFWWVFKFETTGNTDFCVGKPGKRRAIWGSHQENHAFFEGGRFLQEDESPTAGTSSPRRRHTPLRPQGDPILNSRCRLAQRKPKT